MHIGVGIVKDLPPFGKRLPTVFVVRILFYSHMKRFSIENNLYFVANPSMTLGLHFAFVTGWNKWVGEHICQKLIIVQDGIIMRWEFS